MNFTGFFIKRTVFTSLMAFSIFLAGIITFHLIPVSALPKLDFPAIQVKVNLPGATPEVMGRVVALPLERIFQRFLASNPLFPPAHRAPRLLICNLIWIAILMRLPKMLGLLFQRPKKLCRQTCHPHLPTKKLTLLNSLFSIWRSDLIFFHSIK